MLIEINLEKEDDFEKETLSSFIEKENDYKISHKALFIGFKHRMKVEFLRSFIV